MKCFIYNHKKILINKSLSTRIVPGSLKIAKVTQIHKSNDREPFNNYRYYTNYITKIVEKIMHKRLLISFLHNQFSTQANMDSGKNTQAIH